MDYAQEHVATLHDITDPTPAAPAEESAVVVPIAGDTLEAVTPEFVFGPLEAVGPTDVIVPLRAPAAVTTGFREWVAQYDLSVTTVWCDAPALSDLLEEHDLGGSTGKGRDVWLGLGIAADRAEYVAVHDADATTYDESTVPRLLAPLAVGYEFVKGYYARVEDAQLYGRLVRLFIAPLVRALEERQAHPFVRYLAAFRYPLAGEFAVTADAARHVRAQRAWGLEIGMLGETYETVGPEGSAQVDLGLHQHDHKPVGGRGGLSSMAEQVGAALLRTVEEAGVDPDYETLTERYIAAGERLVEQYAADAAFNGLAYDRAAEREQVEAYAAGIRRPGPDTRLPAWADVDLSPATVVETAQEDRVRAVDGDAD
jgi:glucosyl-3-phosphoglycerate synthase